MLFAHDTELALAGAAALVNTGRGEDDLLADPAGLGWFLSECGWSTDSPPGQADLAAVRALRERLARLWDMNVDEAATLVNALLREASALPQVVRHDGWDYHLHATPPGAPVADRLAVEMAMAFADVIRTNQWGRLRVCAADGCRDVLVDLSKNQSRRFCGTACANRTNVAAYRNRRAARS